MDGWAANITERITIIIKQNQRVIAHELPLS